MHSLKTRIQKKKVQKASLICRWKGALNINCSSLYKITDYILAFLWITAHWDMFLLWTVRKNWSFNVLPKEDWNAFIYYSRDHHKHSGDSA